MTYKGKVAVCSHTRTKHSTQGKHHVECLMLILVVRSETKKMHKEIKFGNTPKVPSKYWPIL
jgi:hypothetical protein